MRRLTSFDYLTGIDDFSRMGVLRFKLSAESFPDKPCFPKIVELTIMEDEDYIFHDLCLDFIMLGNYAKAYECGD